MKTFIVLLILLSLFANYAFALDDPETPFTLESTKGAKINLYYNKRAFGSVGKQNPILLVHGFNSDGSVWRDDTNNYVQQLTQEGYDVIVVDMRGNAVDIDGDHKIDMPVVGDSWGYGVKDLGDDVGIALIEGLDYLNKNLPGREYKKADVITHSTGALAVTSYSRSQGLIPYRNNIDTIIELAPPNNGSTSLVANIKEIAQIMPSVFTQSMTAYEYALELLETKVWIPGGRMESETLRKELMPESLFIKSLEGMGPHPDITTYIAIGNEDWVVGDWSPVIEEREDIGYEYFLGLDHFGFCNSGLVITALLDKLANGETSNFFRRFKPYKNKNMTAFLSGPGIDHPDDTFDAVTFAKNIDISPRDLFFLYLRIGARKNKQSLLKYWHALMLFEEAQGEAGGNEQDIINKWDNLLAQENAVLKDCHARASKEYSESPDIAILANGYFNELAKLIIEKVREPTRIITHDFSPSILNEQKVLMIPSGGLSGLSHSAIFKKKLSEFAENGGTIVIFSQQFGYDFSALPGSGLKGYGWQEDASCHSKAARIENFHQIFASQQGLYPDFKLDGYFTDYPDSATVLLRRSKNLMPAMLMYDYGKGKVIASSLYSDWGYTNGQASPSEIGLIQDLVRWAKKSQTLQEYKKEEPFYKAMDISKDFDEIEMLLISPDGAILEKNISSEPVYEPGAALTGPGIYAVDYILYNSSGEAVQPRTEGFYFCFAQPPEGSVSDPDFNFHITSDRENYAADTEVTFTFHLKNNTPRGALIKCKAGLNHHDINFTESLIVPANSVTSFDKKIIARASDLMKADFYSSGNYFLGHAERGINIVQPSVEVKVLADKMQYVPGQTILMDSTVINDSKAGLGLFLVLNVSGSGRELYHNSRSLVLGAAGTDSWQEYFKIPEDTERGLYQIRLDAFSNSRLVGSSREAIDIPGPLVYPGDNNPGLLTIEMGKQAYGTGELISAKAIINNQGKKIDSAALDIRVLEDVNTGYLTGVIKDEKGEPVKGALVNNIYTNQKGVYNLKRLKAGNLVLSVTAQGYDRITKELKISAGANYLDLVMIPADYGSLSGALPYLIGSDLSLEPIDVAGSESSPRKTVILKDGGFELKTLPAGIYRLRIQPEDITETIQIKKGENILEGFGQGSPLIEPDPGGQAENGKLYQEIGEAEPNNDFLTAAKVGSAANVHGKIYDTGDEDYFELVVDAPCLLTVSLKNIHAGFRPHIIIYNVAGKWLGSTAGLSGQDLEYSIEIAKAGIYYLHLKDRYNNFSSEQEYLIKIDFISGSDQYEPNHDFNSAKAVDLRKNITSTMFPNGDEDYFAVDLAGKGEFYIRLNAVPDGLRPSLKLYDSSGRPVAQKGGSSGEEIDLEAEIEGPGRHYLLIRDWYSNFSSMEAYSFQAYFISAIDEYEPNDAREGAVTLEAGKGYFATIAIKGDNDFYRLSLPDSGSVIINLDDVPFNIRPYIRLYKEPKNSWVSSAAGSAGEGLTMNFSADAPSNYFMQVQDRYNSESSPSRYRLSFLFIPEDLYLPDGPEIFHQGIGLSNIANKKEVNIEIPGIERSGKFYLQAALDCSGPQGNSQAVERFYVGDVSTGPPPSPRIEISCLDNDAVFESGKRANFRFKAINKGNTAGRCEVQFKFGDLFDQGWSGFLDAGAEDNMEFNFLIPVDMEEGMYEGAYVFNGGSYPVKFKISGLSVDVEAGFEDNLFKVDLTNTGSIDSAELFIEVSCNGFKETRDFTLTDKAELVFEVQGTGGRDKIYYGIYFSSGKALYLNSFLLDGEQAPESRIKVVGAYCDKNDYSNGDMVDLGWEVISKDTITARLAADLISPDLGSVKIIDEDFDLAEGANILEKRIKPVLENQGLYRIVYRFIIDGSIEAQGSVFFDAGDEIKVELYLAGSEYLQGEGMDFTARCFSSGELDGRLALVIDGKVSAGRDIDLNGYQEFIFGIKENKPGGHVAYARLSYDGLIIDSNKERFEILERPKPNHPPVFFAIGGKIVLAGELLEFSVEAEDKDGDIIVYSAEGLPDGAVFGGRRFFWTPGADQIGEYLIAFSATDGKDTVREIVKIVVKEAVVLPGEPLADPISGIAPLEVYFNPDSVSGEGIVKHEWDFDGRGVYDFSSLGPEACRFVYTGQGKFPVKLRATHSDGSSDIHVVDIDVGKNPDAPEVYLVASPSSGVSPCRVYFQGDTARAQDICKYEWDFNGDGVYDACSTESAEVIKTYGVPGSYSAELRVTSVEGLSASETVLVGILDPLILSAEPVIFPDSGNIPLQVDFDAEVDADSKIAKYKWDFEGDGVYDLVSLDSPAAVYTYDRPGVYMPTLRITDENNVSVEAKKELRIGVLDIEAIKSGDLTVSAEKGKAPLTTQFVYTSDLDSPGPIYLWDFNGDGDCDLITTLPEAEFTYDAPGAYIAEVRVKNKDDFSGSSMKTIYITKGRKAGKDNDEADVLLLTGKKDVFKDKMDRIKLIDRTSLVLPAGILDSDDVVHINKLQEDSISQEMPLREDMISTGEYREYKFTNHKGGFTKEMIISIPYEDVDDDGIVDGKNIDELTLEACWFNEEDGGWQVLPDALVFPKEDIVTVRTNHFSVFGIIGKEAGSGDKSIPEGEEAGSKNDENSPSCFIATAAFGTPAAKEVQILCDFRNNYLLKTAPGRAFIKAYYYLSPPVTRFIQPRPFIRFLIRQHIKLITCLIRCIM